MSTQATAPAPNSTPQKPARDTKQRAISALVSFVLVGFVLSYLVGPAAWQWMAATERQAELSDYTDKVFQQFTNIPAPQSDAELVARLKAAPTSGQAGPIVLTYHDIGYNGSEYTITPEAFASQMQLLADAGWQTLSAAQLSDWLDGKPLPPHSVQITFDDGAHGIWQYADPILARNNQRAVAYIITGFVGTRNPYYATWSELTRMQASGRWDIQAHTHLGHVEIPTDAAGTTGPFLTNLKYLPEENRTETPAEFQARVSGDLQESKNQLVARGFPEPQFFAYPFSAHTEVAGVDGVLAESVQSLFKAAMLDTPHEVMAVRPGELAAGNVDRMDMTADVSLNTYVDRILAVSPISPSSLKPLSMPDEWTTYGGAPATLPLDSSGGTAFDPGPGAYGGRLFAPFKTGLWTRYTVDAVLGGFKAADEGMVTGLTVLTKDPQQVDVSVTANGYTIAQANGAEPKVLAQGVLPVSASHRAEIVVDAGAVTVTIDGQQVSSIPLVRTGRYGPAGPVQITGYRESDQSPVPQVLSMSVR
ncbi:Putative xylanase/chitin deacetylase [Arthrobacter sp. 9AX]|uniref:polysaccharide deacetylase family protein n=1 Tax=Arthrobacter sp. 9AX TaxID=2653131 RepID=UPI0012F38BA7|nr:polysaccharide deacetylase family protein [Arthrobacter sp. 9AX]VXB78443.1 Putative xylanase/chitin deacetylase [Arthrobacter sp. 9AX]